jgi:hypothetical protein
LQPVAISRKSTERRSGRNRPKPLPPGAMVRRGRRFESVRGLEITANQPLLLSYLIRKSTSLSSCNAIHPTGRRGKVPANERANRTSEHLPAAEGLDGLAAIGLIQSRWKRGDQHRRCGPRRTLGTGFGEQSVAARSRMYRMEGSAAYASSANSRCKRFPLSGSPYVHARERRRARGKAGEHRAPLCELRPPIARVSSPRRSLRSAMTSGCSHQYSRALAAIARCRRKRAARKS